MSTSLYSKHFFKIEEMYFQYYRYYNVTRLNHSKHYILLHVSKELQDTVYQCRVMMESVELFPSDEYVCEKTLTR